MSMESLLETFFAECEELIEALSDGLGRLAAGESGDDLVNAIFRAVHSIKGAGGAFGFEDLVSFAHVYETVLDRIRGGQLAIEAEVLRVITRAADVLAELVENAQNEGAGTPSALAQVRVALEGYAGVAPAAPSPEPSLDFAPMAFEPISFDLDTPDPGGRWRFVPDAAFYRNGHEPMYVFSQLRAVGELKVSCDFAEVPSLAGLDPDGSYLVWEIESADLTEDVIHQTLQFLAGLYELSPVEDTEIIPDAEDHPSRPVPADTPAPATTASATSASPRATLRVDPERVDRLINTVGELIINQSVIGQKVGSLGLEQNSELLSALEDYRYLAREIQEAVMSIRAQPVKPLFQRMARVVREAAEATGKDVEFVVTGEGTEIDKTLVERLADPLTHMLRNSVDHGIETVADRSESGKSLVGTVKLSAFHRSGHVVIEISDDGKGLDREKILASAIGKGLVPEEARLSEQEIDNFLFMPGFSTAAEVTNLSGRGVGMDVVKTAITSMGGRVTIATEFGRGTTFSIILPLTLAVLDGMVVSVAEQTMVLPISGIVETIRPARKDVKSVGPQEDVILVRGSFVPVVALGKALGFASPNQKEPTYILVETESSGILALSVDGIWDQRQVVIKSLEGNYGNIPGVSAATILGDGKIALIVDVEAIAQLAASTGSKPRLTEQGIVA